MRTLLADIELDLEELQYLLKTIATEGNPALRKVAQRNIQQMQKRLERLSALLDDGVETPNPEPTPEQKNEPTTPEPIAERTPEPAASEPAHSPMPEPVILAERIRPAADLRHALSLNDTFRFARELFGGNTMLMNQAIQKISNATTRDEALDLLAATIRTDETNEALAEFTELIEKYFQ